MAEAAVERAGVDLNKHPSGIVPTLQNVVATVTMGCPLDLKTIALKARNAEYNPKRFAAVIMRVREPKTTALIFSSGKMVCTGAKSEEQSRQAARKVCMQLCFASARATWSVLPRAAALPARDLADRRLTPPLPPPLRPRST